MNICLIEQTKTELVTQMMVDLDLIPQYIKDFEEIEKMGAIAK